MLNRLQPYNPSAFLLVLLAALEVTGVRTAPGQSAPPSNPGKNLPASASPSSAPGTAVGSDPTRDRIDAITLSLYDQYIARVGKISSDSVQAAIVLVAERGHGSPALRDLLAKDLARHSQREQSSNERTKLLSLLARVLQYDGSQRWQLEQQQRTGEIGQAVLPPPEHLDRESALLDLAIEYGRNCGSSDIDAFVLAVRQAHHRQGIPFLRDVLHNPSTSTPTAPTVPTAAKSKWADGQGGSWQDARFHAAVALAELGAADGVRWLIENARPNEFGIDGTVFRHTHWQATGGSLRLNCQHALHDLSGLQHSPDQPTDWDAWWQQSGATFVPQRVNLRL